MPFYRKRATSLGCSNEKHGPPPTMVKKRLVNAYLVLFLLLLSFAGAVAGNGYTSLNMHIYPQTKNVADGDFIIVIVDLYLFNVSERMDIPLTYTVRDKGGNIISSKTLTMATETHLSDVNKIYIPLGTKQGMYMLEVMAELPGQTFLKTSDSFNVRGMPSGEADYTTYVFYLICILLLLVFVVIFLIYKILKIHEKEMLHEQR